MKYRTVFNFNKMSFVKGKPKLFFAILLFSITTGSLSVPNASGAGGPTAHINWSGVSLSTTSGFSHSITPLVDAVNNSWTFFSPCGPDSTNLCFEMGILNNHNAWIRVESTDQYRSTGTANCHTRAPNIFQDANSKGLDCNLFMNDFAAGTKYDFSITPEGTGPGNWWTASYRNTKTGVWVPLVQFRFDLTASAALNMQNFTLTDQLNYGINDTVVADCNQVPLASAIFGKPNNTNSSNQVLYTGLGYMNCAHYRIDDLQDGSGSKLVNFGSDGNYVSTSTSSTSNNSQQKSSEGSIPGAAIGSTLGKLVRPSSGGLKTSALCSVGDAITGIQVADRLVAPFLSGLKFDCSRIKDDGSLTPELAGSHSFLDLLPSGASYNSYSCSPGYAAVALNVLRNNYIMDVSITCANVKTYALSTVPTLGAGTHNTLNDSSSCADSSGKGYFLSGIGGYSAAGVDGIQAVCSKFAINSAVLASSNLLLSFVPPVGNYDDSKPLPSKNMIPSVLPSELAPFPIEVGGNSASAFGFQSDEIFTPNHFMAFQITPALGKQVQVDRIEYSSCSYKTPTTGSSATNAAIYTSVDDFSTPIGVPTQPLNPDQLTKNIIFPIPSLVVKSKTEFRIHFWGAKGLNWNDLCGDTRGTGLQIFGTTIAIPVQNISAPKNLSFSYANGIAKLSVDLPDLVRQGVTSVFLVSPTLGYSSKAPLSAIISGTKGFFSVPVDKSLQGKSIPVQIYSSTTTSESAPLTSQFDIPKIATIQPKSVPVLKPNSGKKVLSKSNSQLTVPDAPSSPNYSIEGNKVVVTVLANQREGAIATGALLLAPSLGFTNNHPVVGRVNGNKVIFTVNLTKSMSGKSAQIAVYLTNSVGSSAPLAGQVTLPPVIEDAVPQGTAKATSSTCTKGASKRTFSGSACPPGWKRS